MSSPLASLKKVKKAPFPTAQQGSQMPSRASSRGDDASFLSPFSRSNASSRRTSDVSLSKDDALLEEISSRMANERLGKRSQQGIRTKLTPLPGKQDRNPLITAPDDQELLSVMMGRLAQAEARLKMYAKEIIDKDKRIQVLEEKLHRTGKGPEMKSGPMLASEWERKCHQLEKKVVEMEHFLADYGLVWVGEKSDSSSYSSESSARSWHPDVSFPAEFVVDYDIIIENIHELNLLAGEGQQKITRTVDGARLRAQETIPLTLYANGIVMFSGPFRPFTDSKTQQCVQDLTDGFFPAELQLRHPDGVPLVVVDKRDVYFEDPRAKLFQGEGRTLKDSSDVTETDKVQQVPSSFTANRRIESELPGQKLSVDQFLNKLPPVVIKDGKVIDVRDSVKGMLAGPGPSPVREMVIATSANNPNASDSETKTTTLRIKSETGDETYVLRMNSDETIGDLRKYLNTKRTNQGDYDILCAFPRLLFDDNSKTLFECNLVPNAALLLRPKKKK